MNDWLSQVLDMKNISILKPLKQKSYKKLVIDVTASEVGRLIQILNQAGAGQKASILEQYDMKKKEKYIKNLDEQESLQEVIEISSFILEENLSDIRRLLGKDFYYEVFEIDNINQSFGLGRVGTIRPASLEQVAEKIKSLFSLDHVRLVGDREAIIKKIAVVGGSGSDLIIDAKLKGCDAIITGDVGFHDAQLALAANINILDPGHNIEIIFNDVMSDFINLFDEVTCFASEVDTNPFEVI